MSDLFSIILPLFGFMLIPVWIPIVAAMVGRVVDRIAGPPASSAQRLVEGVKARSEETRLRNAAVERVLPTREVSSESPAA